MAERRWANNIVGHGEADPRTLVAHPDNPKVHLPVQDRVVRASLERSGWLKSVQVNTTTGHVLDGHDRIKLAIEDGEATVPVEYVCIPEEDEPVALITLDASVGLAQPDVGKWQKLAAQARQQTRDPALLGLWAQFAVQHHIAQPPLGEEGGEGDDERGGGAPAPERGAGLQAQWETGLGDLWGCGEHRVWCGDCTTAEGWDLLRAHVGPVRGCVTSPPYAEQRLKQYGGVPAEGYVQWFLPLAAHLQTALAPEGSFFLNLKEHSDGIRRPVYVHALVVALVEAGWTYLDEFVWDRPGVPGDPVARGKFKNMWEPVFWFATQVRPVFHPERVRHHTNHAIVESHWQPGLNVEQGTGRDFMGGEGRKGPGWAYPGNRLPSFGTAEALGHAAAFPVGLPQWFIDVYSEEGDWWVDPFGGAGSTLLACAHTHRRGWLMERDPRAVAITLERWTAEGGERPQRLK